MYNIHSRAFVVLPEEDRYIRSKIRSFDLTQFNSCLVQNMTINAFNTGLTIVENKF